MKSIFLKVVIIFACCNYQLNAQVNDCPYVFHEKNQLVVKWIEAGELIEKALLNKRDRELQVKFCPEFIVKSIREEEPVNNEQVFTGVKKVAALSDIHGQYELFIRLLKSNQIIDDNKNWNFGKGHFVIVGDVFDRGDKVTETLWFLYHLEQQAEQAGGKVHLLLGNHEIMVLKADLRYLNEKYETVSEIMGLGYEQLFSDETVLGHWLRTKPVVVSINDVAYTHGGLSMALVENNISLEKINALFHNSIIDHDKEEIMENDQLRLLIKSNGPIWYRGYFKDEQFNKTQIETILDHFNCKKIVVGHTSMDEVMPHFDGLVFNVDSSIKKGENGEILLYENSQWYRGILNGNRIKL